MADTWDHSWTCPPAIALTILEDLAEYQQIFWCDSRWTLNGEKLAKVGLLGDSQTKIVKKSTMLSC